MPPARASCPPPGARADLHPEFQRAIENVEARAHGVGDGLFERRYGLPGDGLVRPHVDGGPSAIDRRVRDGHAGTVLARALHMRATSTGRIHVVGAPVAVRSATWVRVRGASASRTHRIPTASAAMAAGRATAASAGVRSTRRCSAARAHRRSRHARSAVLVRRRRRARGFRSPSPRQRARPPARRSAAAAVTMSAGTGVGHAPRRTRRREGPRCPRRGPRGAAVDGGQVLDLLADLRWTRRVSSATSQGHWTPRYRFSATDASPAETSARGRSRPVKRVSPPP